MDLREKAEIWHQWFQYYEWYVNSIDTSTSHQGYVEFIVMANDRIYVVDPKTTAWLARFERPFFILNDLPMVSKWLYCRDGWEKPGVLRAWGLDAEDISKPQAARPILLPHGIFETPRQFLRRCGVLS